MPAQKKCAARFRSGLLPIIATAWLVTIGIARASDVDSEHLFGFTEGADIGKKGEREAETETIGRFGKSGGSYTALTQNNQVKWLPVENLRVGANVAVAYFDIGGVSGLSDARLVALQGVSFDARFHLMDRHSGPFGVTLIAEPRWGRIDATSGETSTGYGGIVTLAIDRELIDDCLFGTFNVLYDSQAIRKPLPENWIYDSKIGVSAAIAARVTPAFFIGGEMRHVRAYDGLGLDQYSGHAIFAGPTLYLQLAKGMAISAAWNMQISGSLAAGGPLDLTHFERQQAKARFNVNF